MYKIMKNKLLASSNTLQGIEKLLNKYYYSTSYKITEDLIITNSKGIFDKVFIKKDKNRYKLYQK